MYLDLYFLKIMDIKWLLELTYQLNKVDMNDCTEAIIFYKSHFIEDKI